MHRALNEPVTLAFISLDGDKLHNSEVCHLRCAFKLYGEMNSVKKHNYKLWLNDAVCWQGRTTCFGL